MARLASAQHHGLHRQAVDTLEVGLHRFEEARLLRLASGVDDVLDAVQQPVVDGGTGMVIHGPVCDVVQLLVDARNLVFGQ